MELKDYLQKSNLELLSDFRWGGKGQHEFNHFMRLVRQEIELDEPEMNVTIYECRCGSFTSIEIGEVVKCCAICGEPWGDNMHVGGTGSITKIVENG